MNGSALIAIQGLMRYSSFFFVTLFGEIIHRRRVSSCMRVPTPRRLLCTPSLPRRHPSVPLMVPWSTASLMGYFCLKSFSRLISTVGSTGIWSDFNTNQGCDSDNTCLFIFHSLYEYGYNRGVNVTGNQGNELHQKNHKGKCPQIKFSNQALLRVPSMCSNLSSTVHCISASDWKELAADWSGG